MQKPDLQRPIWETFIRLPPAETADLAPECDEAVLGAIGAGSAAPQVLRILRDEVAPALRRLHAHGDLWYAFLVHDGASGVPTTPDDKALYIHLRFQFVDGDDAALEFIDEEMPAAWAFTRKVELAREIAGLDPAVLLDGDIAHAWSLLGLQSLWLLGLLSLHPTADGMQLVRHVRQFLHFFANMAQMRVA